MQVFTLSVPTSVWIIVGVIAAALAVVTVIIVLPIAKFTIVVSSSYIRAYSPIMFKVNVERSQVAHVSVVNLEKAAYLKPTIRLFGVGLPGYKLGWFKLANGAKAFLAVTSSGEAVVIELRDGTYVILTPKDFEDFVEALRINGWME